MIAERSALRAAGSALRAAGSALRAAGSALRAAGSALRAAGSALRAAGSRLRAGLRSALLRRAPRIFLWTCTAASTAEIGLAGEELVARTLRRQGHGIEGRRVRTPWGELDVLARDGRGLVCVEVKTARLAPMPRIRGAARVALPDRDHPGARVDARGLERLGRIADGIARRRHLPARWEVWEVRVGPGRGRVEVRRWPAA